MNGGVSEDVLITEPNRMSEIYRKFQPSSIPLEIEKHLNFIDISEDGCMLLGSSTLNGRYWTGSIHYFDTVTTSVSKDGCLTGMNCEAVITDGKFIDSKDKVVIGEDSGCISLLSLADIEDEGIKSTHVVVNVATYDHDSAVLSLSLSPNKLNFVSGSMDKCIKVWDTEGLITQYTFRPAHSHLVTSVQYSPTSNNIFASCSLDGYALMWDTRLEKPALEIRKNNGEGLTSVAWHPLKENLLAVGSNYGTVSLSDVRSLNSVASVECFHRPLHKLTFNNNGYLAACGDTHELKVLEFQNDLIHTIYSDDSHNYFVRGLSWHPQHNSELYSCGWDEKIICHNLQSIENNAS